jgi:hypothetical protein
VATSTTMLRSRPGTLSSQLARGERCRRRGPGTGSVLPVHHCCLQQFKPRCQRCTDRQTGLRCPPGLSTHHRAAPPRRGHVLHGHHSCHRSHGRSYKRPCQVYERESSLQVAGLFSCPSTSHRPVPQRPGETNSGWSRRRSQVPSGWRRSTCAQALAPSLGGVEVSAMSPLIRVGSAGSGSKCGCSPVPSPKASPARTANRPPAVTVSARDRLGPRNGNQTRRTSTPRTHSHLHAPAVGKPSSCRVATAFQWALRR